MTTDRPLEDANYIVCLSHFCELHGPSTIMCTQKTSPEMASNYMLPLGSKLQTCASCKLLLPNDSVNIKTLSGLSSEDDSKEMAYVSTQYPASDKRYTSLTKLVMKGLSVETSSDITKPMFFGDSTNGYCMNKMFKLKDVCARGGDRKYILMLVGDSESHILQNWEITTHYFNEMIELLQETVDLVTEKNANMNSTNDLDNERYLRRSVIKPKSLVELTDDPGIFIRLHLWAVELLKDNAV